MPRIARRRALERRSRPTTPPGARPRWLLVAALALSTLLAGSAAAAGITVSASGVAYGAPDMARLEVGFTATDPDVAEALAEADAAIESVRSALEASGVDERDVRTTTFAVWREDRFADRQGPTTVVYRVIHHLEVTVRDVDAVGLVLVAATEAGANHVGGIQYTVQDARELEASARRRAYEAALEKAEQLAALAGLTLGPPVEVVESPPGGSIGPMDRSAIAFADGGAPVSGGQLAVEVRLDVRFVTTP